MKLWMIAVLVSLLSGCSSVKYEKTVKYVDIDRFMGKWFVIAGRLTSFEKGAHNAVEVYVWNQKEKRIEIDFTYRKDGYDGELKKLPQVAWIEDEKTNAHWKVRPFWPLKFNYYVIALSEDYSWTVIGVPGMEWIWIMGRHAKMSDEKLKMIVESVGATGYDVSNIKRVPQQW